MRSIWFNHGGIDLRPILSLCLKSTAVPFPPASSFRYQSFQHLNTCRSATSLLLLTSCHASKNGARYFATVGRAGCHAAHARRAIGASLPLHLIVSPVAYRIARRLPYLSIPPASFDAPLFGLAYIGLLSSYARRDLMHYAAAVK